MEVTMTVQKKLLDVSEKIQTISQSVYIQWGMVVSLLALTAFFVEFRVTTQSDINQLKRQQDEAKQVMKEFETKYPTREWLEAKLENIRLEIKHSQIQKAN